MILLPKQICWGIKVVDGVKVASQLTLKREIFLDYLSGPNISL